MTIQFHYCCGKLKEVKLSSAPTKQCGMKHVAPTKKKCCDDKQLELKIKSDQKTEQATKFNFSAPTIAKQEKEFYVAQPVVSQTIISEIFAPPPLQNPLYIFHCIYRI
jgi:hypothetical protein